jgi:hypothetical protein
MIARAARGERAAYIASIAFLSFPEPVRNLALANAMGNPEEQNATAGFV